MSAFMAFAVNRSRRTSGHGATSCDAGSASGQDPASALLSRPGGGDSLWRTLHRVAWLSAKRLYEVAAHGMSGGPTCKDAEAARRA
jgi:hypothetical protein